MKYIKTLKDTEIIDGEKYDSHKTLFLDKLHSFHGKPGKILKGVKKTIKIWFRYGEETKRITEEL